MNDEINNIVSDDNNKKDGELSIKKNEEVLESIVVDPNYPEFTPTKAPIEALDDQVQQSNNLEKTLNTSYVKKEKIKSKIFKFITFLIVIAIVFCIYYFYIK